MSSFTEVYFFPVVRQREIMGGEKTAWFNWKKKKVLTSGFPAWGEGCTIIK
jgi:hypothetical protein